MKAYLWKQKLLKTSYDPWYFTTPPKIMKSGFAALNVVFKWAKLTRL